MLYTTAIVFAALPVNAAITQLTGDVTAGPGSGSQAATLPFLPDDPRIIDSTDALSPAGPPTDWTETDTWTLSEDGKTLTNKSSDGKILVYDKQDKDKVY